MDAVETVESKKNALLAPFVSDLISTISMLLPILASCLSLPFSYDDIFLFILLLLLSLRLVFFLLDPTIEDELDGDSYGAPTPTKYQGYGDRGKTSARKFVKSQIKC